MHFIPVIPESAPFTAEQRAYLNGFLAGLFSHAPIGNASSPASPPVPALVPISIFFGSQTGTAEKLAKRLVKEAGKRGFAPTIYDLGQCSAAQLVNERHALFITSTYGDGEPPDNAKTFWDILASDQAPKLPLLRFSLCALGDSNYAKFCGFGKQMDARLEELGATRASPRTDCDVDWEDPFTKWMTVVLAELTATANVASVDSHLAESTPVQDDPEGKPSFSKEKPFSARLHVNSRLNTVDSSKDVRHIVIDLTDGRLPYEAGDALGVFPRNCPHLINEILAALGASGEEPVPSRDERSVSFREALESHYEITRIPKPLLEGVASRTGDETLVSLVSSSANGELPKFLWGREIIDLLLAHPAVKFHPAEFIGLLRKLQPRLYSISSSPKAHPKEVHLTVGALRYESMGRNRRGVCSTFLADRAAIGSALPVFVHSNPGFRPPLKDVPLIMVGPGTGIAPFRAFLEERSVTGARGKNWLFFGDQRAASDFLYQNEIESFLKQGVLTRLDLAWSRDQADKVYVQHRMLAHARELFDWLEQGGAFYVCGDANRMAKDVDAALHQVITKGGGRTTEEASCYVKMLKTQKRYLRDVY